MSGNRRGRASQLSQISRSRFTVLWGGQARACLFGLSLVLSILIGSLPTARAEAPAGKTDLFLRAALSRRHTAGWSSILLRLDGPLTPERQARLERLRADIYRHLPVIQSVAARVPTCNLASLAALPFVRHLSLDTIVQKCDTFTVGHSGADVAYASYGLNGSGITVAVLDSGIKNVADLQNPATNSSRILANVTFVSGSNATSDNCGHGTHVAGIIAGNGALSTGKSDFTTFYGIARNCNLVNIQVLNGQGQGTVCNVVSGIQWAITNRSKYNIRVLSLSLGHPVGDHYVNDPLCQACESAWKAGICVVCAAGNEGRLNSAQTAGQPNEGYGTAYGSIQSPGNDPYVITVGAMKNMDGNRAHDRIATYSSRGPTRLDLTLKPDIVAPGNRVISLCTGLGGYLPANYPGNIIPTSTYTYTAATAPSSSYYLLSGTSMATPVVAGAAALMLQANPSLTPDTIKARLMASADKWSFPDGTTDACTFGAGYLDIPAALACTLTPTMFAQSPSLSQDSSGNVYVNINNAIWGKNALWGSGLQTLNAIWGKNALWGSNTLSSSNAIWGKSIWSDTAIWGECSGAVDLSANAIYGE